MILRGGVVRLAELHDVDAVLTQCGTNGRRGVGLASLDLELDKASDLLLRCHYVPVLFLRVVRGCCLTGAVRYPLVLLDLVEAEFDRSLSTEDLHQSGDLLGVDVDF